MFPISKRILEFPISITCLISFEVPKRISKTSNQ